MNFLDYLFDQFSKPFRWFFQLSKYLKMIYSGFILLFIGGLTSMIAGENNNILWIRLGFIIFFTGAYCLLAPIIYDDYIWWKWQKENPEEFKQWKKQRNHYWIGAMRRKEEIVNEVKNKSKLEKDRLKWMKRNSGKT